MPQAINAKHCVIKRVTKHTTTRMVAHYVKDANKKQQASPAIQKLENVRRRRTGKRARV